MILTLRPATIDRLRQIERHEGIPPEEFVHQAVEVWSQADAEMRKAIAVSIMKWKLMSLRDRH